MAAAEEDFEAGGRKFRAGAFIIANADRAALEPTLKELGLTALAVAAAPAVKTHDLDVPRIGYVHSWQRTQDEGWVRAAFDHFGVPVHLLRRHEAARGQPAREVRRHRLPARRRHGAAAGQRSLDRHRARAYKKSELTPNLGAQDATDDIRGGMGMEGLLELVKFVREGGTLLVEGSTSVIFPEYGDHRRRHGRDRRRSSSRAARSCAACSPIAKSPIAYGYDAQVPVYFNQDPVLNVGGGGFGGFGGFGGGAADPGRRAEHDADGDAPAAVAVGPGRRRTQKPERPQVDETAQFRQMARQFGIAFDESRRASSCASRRTRTTCCCAARSPAARRSPTARRSSTRRSARATS